MGTAATECCVERPGDGASPGACAADQITPERPEERQPAWQLSRAGATSGEGHSASHVLAFGQGRWYRGAA
jgi:hypothetical protein